MKVLGLGKTISNPKVFTIDNQAATVTQGEEIPYQTTADGTTTTSFKEAALKLKLLQALLEMEMFYLILKSITTHQIELQSLMNHQLTKWR